MPASNARPRAPELPARGPRSGDLTQRPAEPRELADDQAVAALQDARQPGGGRLDEVVDAEVVRSRFADPLPLRGGQAAPPRVHAIQVARRHRRNPPPRRRNEPSRGPPSANRIHPPKRLTSPRPAWGAPASPRAVVGSARGGRTGPPPSTSTVVRAPGAAAGTVSRSRTTRSATLTVSKGGPSRAVAGPVHDDEVDLLLGCGIDPGVPETGRLNVRHRRRSRLAREAVRRFSSQPKPIAYGE